MASTKVINKFIKGVNTDLSEEMLENTMLSNAHNISLTNNSGKQGIVVKSEFMEDINGYDDNLIFLAAKEYNNVLYIVSLNKTITDSQGKPVTEIGTYPSGNLTSYTQETEGYKVPKVDVYAPLPNYYQELDPSPPVIPYSDGFRSKDFGYAEGDEIDIEIQPSYDGSMNIITTKDGTPPRIVNSRQDFTIYDNFVRIITRENNLDNVYSDAVIDKTYLIPVLPKDIPDLTFDGVIQQAGSLKAGGYKYYFKLKTADGVESPLIEESRLVSIHSGFEFGNAGSHIVEFITTNAVKFTITNLNPLGLEAPMYKYVSVYYTIATGQTEQTAIVAYRIGKDYEINGDSCEIYHTGDEVQELVDISNITAEYTPVTSVKTLTQKNNYLLLGNINTSSTTDSLLKTAASLCYVESALSKLHTVRQKVTDGANLGVDDSYANPYNIYYKTAYMPGETYELAINYVFANGAVSAAYPISGYDFVNGITYSPGSLQNGWDANGNNGEGVIRMPQKNIADVVTTPPPAGSIMTTSDWYLMPVTGGTITIALSISPSGAAWDYRFENPYNWIHGGTSTAITMQFIVDANNLTTPTYAYIVFYLKDYPTVTRRIIIGQDGTTVPAQVTHPSQDGTYSLNISDIDVYTMVINTQNMVGAFGASLKSKGVVGYYISRKERIPDMHSEGLLTLTATAPLKSMGIKEDMLYTLGMYAGYGLNGSLGKNIVHYPLPGNATPYSTETLLSSSTTSNTYFFDGVLYASIPPEDKNKYFALYSPDISSDTSLSSFLSNESNYSIWVDSIAMQKITPELISSISTLESRYPYSAGVVSLTLSSGSYKIENMSFVPDGVRALSGNKFTAHLQNQSVFLLYTDLKTKANSGTGLDVASQRSFYNANKGADIYYISDPEMGTASPAIDAYSRILISSVKYSPYVGVEFSSADGITLTNALNINPTGTPSYFTGYNTVPDMLPPDGSTKLGAMCRLYTNDTGVPLTLTAWIDRYKSVSSGDYFAISKRFQIDHALGSTVDLPNSQLIGGDCYTGIYYQQVWRPAGIEGVPTASTPSDYILDSNGIVTRHGTAITNSGYAIGFPVRSRYNFSIRAFNPVDKVEKELFGKDRTYTSSLVTSDVHGNRQPETSVINYGNIVDKSVFLRPAYTNQIPFSKISYKNRLVTSEISTPGEFQNGYRDFRGLNFKDYDEDLGEITTIVSGGVYTYVVYTSGVSLVEVAERTAITSQDIGTNVYLSTSNVLPPKSTPILTSIGSQHLNSVLSIETAVVGVDADNKKIWLADKTNVEIISDQRVQYLLDSIIKDGVKDIVTTYDSTTYDIIFSFFKLDGTEISLVYNAKFKVWYGSSDTCPLMIANIEGKRINLQTDQLGNVRMYKPIIGRYSEMDDKKSNESLIDKIASSVVDINDSYIEFVVKSQNGEKVSLPNILINGEGVPKQVDIVSPSTLQYSIMPSPNQITGVYSDTIPTITNIYMKIADQASLATNQFIITRTENGTYRKVNIGDAITLIVSGMAYHHTVADVKYNVGTTDIVVDRQIAAGIPEALYYGWKLPYRLLVCEKHDNTLKLNIPSAVQSSRMAGLATDPQLLTNSSASKIPADRWIKVRLWFSGLAPISIDSVISDLNIVYS